jgi:hypothetical protein
MTKTMTREQAKKLGLTRYFSGLPCKHGHVDERNTRSNACHSCVLVSNAARRPYLNEISRAYCKRHYEKRKGHAFAYAKRSKSSTPAWVDRSKLAEFKRRCAPGWHVDHIVPLKGITPEGYKVFGLNVLWNLQYLPASENTAKGNRMTARDMKIACSLSHRRSALWHNIQRMQAAAKLERKRESARRYFARQRKMQAG